MLILTRFSQQSIMINDDIKIVILSIANGQVKIGIEAPRSFPIYRQELYTKIQKSRENLSNINHSVKEKKSKNLYHSVVEKIKKHTPLITLKSKKLLNGETKFYLSSDASTPI